MNEQKAWGIGSHIWMAFLMLTQWLMPLEYWTKPITTSNAAYQQVAWLYTISAIVMTVLFIWLWVKKLKVALNLYLVIAAINAIAMLIQTGFQMMLLSLILPVITWLILHKRVGWI